jgi:hypothetical protein
MTITPSIPIGKQKQNLSAGEWRGIWLGKLEQTFAVKKLNESTAAVFKNFIQSYLLPFTCHPGEINAKAIIDFFDRNKKSEKQAKFCRDALVFFYSNVVPSEKHVEVIKRGFVPSIPTPPMPPACAEASVGRPQGEIISKTPEIIKPPIKMPQKPALRPTDMDWNREVIRIHGKGSKERVVPLDQCFYVPLKTHLAANKGLVYLFEGSEKRQRSCSICDSATKSECREEPGAKNPHAGICGGVQE